ncbi:MAG: acyl-CoA dehydrogenase [SAR324 cluster bacterium]|nr:acyl-CoA dehydrogenase [SAR324 cluster bacterium]
MSQALTTGSRRFTDLITWIFSLKFPEILVPEAPLKEWWHHHLPLISDWDLPIDQALVGGVVAPSMGYAFAAGYQAAIRCLIPSTPVNKLAAFCVTEQGGGHPGAIQTQLNLAPESADGTLSGEKSFVTMGLHADLLLIAASTGIHENGQNIIKMVQLPATTHGLVFHNLPLLPFVPEVPHSRIELKHCPVMPHQILSGDGYQDYIKPFRTVEDIHLLSAIIGYLLQIALRFDWPEELVERLLSLFAAFRMLVLSDLNHAASHLVLAGVLGQFHEVLENLEPLWSRTDDVIASMWERDKKLLAVAEKARKKRLSNAREKLGMRS